LILVDFRDQGRSSRLAEGYDLHRHARDLEALFDALALESVHLMGLSYGGEVALLFAQRALSRAGRGQGPARLRSLILANVPLRTSPYLAAVGRAWEIAAQLHDGSRFFELAIPSVYSAHFYEREGAWLEAHRELFGRVLTPEWFDALVRLSRAARDWSISFEELSRITLPTLLIGADEDHIAPLRDQQVLREHLPDAELLVLHQAGHGAFLERVDAFTTAILGFVTKHA
jgi:pimeloyl-ACP methyl ester carboxylesterase